MPAATFELDGDLGVITLTAPPLNLVSEAFAADVTAAADAAGESTARAVLLQAEGDAFSAGADVSMFQGRTPETGRELIDRFIPALRRFEDLPVPSVAAVHGACLAGGMELALACDLIWASDDAMLGLIEGVIGAIPFGGGIQRFAARAGTGRAREAVLTARMYDAQTMLDWGVVNRVVPRADLHDKARAFGHQLAAGPTLAHGATKRIMRLFEDHGLEAADAALPEIGGRIMASDDVQNGLQSLLEHGPGQASFEGR